METSLQEIFKFWKKLEGHIKTTIPEDQLTDLINGVLPIDAFANATRAFCSEIGLPANHDQEEPAQREG